MIAADLTSYFRMFSEIDDGVEKLRNIALRLAAQGRLTTPDFVPSAPNQDVLWNVPEGWTWSTLGQLADFELGKTPSTREPRYWADTEGTPWISIRDMVHRGFVRKTSRMISSSAVEEVFGRSPVPVGTLLMSFKLTIGKVSITEVDAFHNEAIISIYPRDSVLRDYLFFLLPILSTEGNTRAAIKGNTLNKASLKAIPVPVPPLKAQRTICARLRTIFDSCEGLQRKTQQRDSTRSQLAQTSLQALADAASLEESWVSWKLIAENFSILTSSAEGAKSVAATIEMLGLTGRLARHSVHNADALLESANARHQEALAAGRVKGSRKPAAISPRTPIRVPDHWRTVPLARLLTFGPRNGYSPRSSSEPTSVRVLSLSATTTGTFDPSQYKYVDVQIPEGSHLWLSQDDILIQRGNSLDYVGVAAVYEGRSAQFIYPDLMIKIRVSGVLNTKYLLLVLNSAYGRSYFRNCATGTSKSMPKVSQADVLAFPVPIPPRDEQDRIVSITTRLTTLARQLQQKISLERDAAEQVVAVLSNAVSAVRNLA